MIIYLALSIIIFFCSFIIFYILYQNRGKLESFKDDVAHKEKQIKVRKKLAASKLERKLSSLWGKRKLKNKLSFKFLTNIKKPAISKKILIPKKIPKTKSKFSAKTADIKSDLLEADTFLRQRKLEEAEKKYISIVKTDMKSKEAYMGLGQVYAAKKDWQTAEESYKYIIKLDQKYYLAYKQLSHVLKILKKWNELKDYNQKAFDLGAKDNWINANLGLAYKKTGYPETAEEWYQRAAESDPTNEDYLDSLLDISIINKNKNLAEKTYNTLKEVTSDQVKLQSYRNKLDIL